jgi:hypothetical protein
VWAGWKEGQRARRRERKWEWEGDGERVGFVVDDDGDGDVGGNEGGDARGDVGDAGKESEPGKAAIRMDGSGRSEEGRGGGDGRFESGEGNSPEPPGWNLGRRVARRSCRLCKQANK